MQPTAVSCDTAFIALLTNVVFDESVWLEILVAGSDSRSNPGGADRDNREISTISQRRSFVWRRRGGTLRCGLGLRGNWKSWAGASSMGGSRRVGGDGSTAPVPTRSLRSVFDHDSQSFQTFPCAVGLVVHLRRPQGFPEFEYGFDELRYDTFFLGGPGRL